MKSIIELVKNKLLPNTLSVTGFGIYGYNNGLTYDIYLPTETIEHYYFFTYENGILFDLLQNRIELSDIELCRYQTVRLIEANYKKFLQYSEINIQEHELLTYEDYQSPYETDADEMVKDGDIAYDEGNYTEAFRHYSNAMFVKPFDRIVYANRAYCFIKSQQYNDALDEVCRGGISNPISKQNIFTFTYEFIARIYEQAGDFVTALKYYSLIENNSGFTENIERARCFKNLGRYGEAINLFELKLNTDRSIHTLFEFGEILMSAGLNSKAKTILEEVSNFSVKNDVEWVAKMLEIEYKPLKDRARELLKSL
jgi:tetratricopeptide (TPR) repeat protein